MKHIMIEPLANNAHCSFQHTTGSVVEADHIDIYTNRLLSTAEAAIPGIAGITFLIKHELTGTVEYLYPGIGIKGEAGNRPLIILSIIIRCKSRRNIQTGDRTDDHFVGADTITDFIDGLNKVGGGVETGFRILSASR